MWRRVLASGWIMLSVLFVGPGCRAGEGRGDQEVDCADGLDNDGDGDTDCADSDCADACVASFRIRLAPDTPENRSVDLLYVLDDSPDSDAMFLFIELSSVISELRRRTAGMPDVHVGVTTTDLGSGGSLMITYCEGAGDEARLITGNCMEPTGVPWIVDSAARDCLVERDASGQCTGHECTQQSCAHEPATTLAEDGDGCPRCRNYEAQSLENDVFRCIADVGYQGCGFEQQLEAMYRALDDHPDNAGFLRDGAHLAVVLLNTEDDCSVADPDFWDDSDMGLESELGPYTDFRHGGRVRGGATRGASLQRRPGQRRGLSHRHRRPGLLLLNPEQLAGGGDVGDGAADLLERSNDGPGASRASRSALRTSVACSDLRTPGQRQYPCATGRSPCSRNSRFRISVASSNWR